MVEFDMITIHYGQKFYLIIIGQPYLNWTLAALNHLLSTFQDHFFEGRSRQVFSLILCLVSLESFLMC